MDAAPTRMDPLLGPLLGPLLLRALFSGNQPAGRGDCDCTGERCLCHEPEAYAINNLSRCHHIHFMNMDIHGEARDYLGAMDASSDKIEGHHGVGTWRLPASRSACASFLWRLWEMPALGRDRSDIPDRQVIRGMYDGIHKVRKELSNELKRYTDYHRLHATSSSAEEVDIDEKELFDEGDPTGDSMVTSWLDVRTRQLVMGYLCAFVGFDEHLVDNGYGGRGVTGRQMEDLKNKKWGNLIESLSLSVRRASVCKNLGNRAFQRGAFMRAGYYYVEGVVSLSPWYPSEYFMPAWEAKLTGLTDITFALAINLALVCLRLGKSAIGQFACLSVIRHPFATNRITAKAWHIFHRNVQSLCSQFTRGESSPPSYFQNQLIIAEHQRTFHLAQPQKGTATPSEAGNFTVDHVTKSARMLGDFEQDGDASEDIYSMHLRCWHNAVYGLEFPNLQYEEKLPRSRNRNPNPTRQSPRKPVAATAPEMTRIPEEDIGDEGEDDLLSDPEGDESGSDGSS